MIFAPNMYNALPSRTKKSVLKYVDILVITEKKLDDTFPTSQFLVDGFSEPSRLDSNKNGGGIMIFVLEDVPSKLLQKHVLPVVTEGFFIDLNFRKCKWLLFGTCHPPSQEDQYYCNNLDKGLDTYCQYDNILLSDDFNSETSEVCLDSFLYQHDIKKFCERKNRFQKCV